MRLLFIIEVGNLGSKVGRELRGIKFGDGFHTALARQQTAQQACGS